jgi:Leucine-rich repeat (LRR) protein
VEDLSPLSGLASLQQLFAMYSQVRELSPLLSLPSLRYLALLGNPLSQRPSRSTSRHWSSGECW